MNTALSKKSPKPPSQAIKNTFKLDAPKHFLIDRDQNGHTHTIYSGNK